MHTPTLPDDLANPSAACAAACSWRVRTCLIFEVESALMTHPAVLECAITAADDPVRGQVVKATIVLTKQYTASDELKKELQNHVKKVTAPYKYPRIVEFVDELPKTTSGKIMRAQIRRNDANK